MTIVNVSFFFFNDTATTEIYTLSLHDALPIFAFVAHLPHQSGEERLVVGESTVLKSSLEELLGSLQPSLLLLSDSLSDFRSEEHTSELQSRQYLVCRLLLEKKKINCTISTCYA